MRNSGRILRIVRMASVLLMALLIFLITAYLAGVTENEIINQVSLLAFTALLIIVVTLLRPILVKVLPHGAGFGSEVELPEREGEIHMAYPPGFRMVPFGILAVIFIAMVYLARVRSSLPVVQTRPLGQEAIDMAILFLGGSVVFAHSLFIWIHSADYTFNEEGFRWTAPWSRKRFVRWEEVEGVWHAPWLGMGIWLKTTKGRFRIDFDMVNARLFMDHVRGHRSSSLGVSQGKNAG